MTEENSSFDELYREDGDLNFEGILYREDSGGWSPSQAIDWDQDIELSEEQREAIATGVSQFLYSNTFHLMLCGRLLERSDDMAVKKLALFLGFSKMRNIDAFGRYLGRIGSRKDVSPHTKEFFKRMTEEEDIPTLVLGMAVLGGTVGYGVLDKVRDAGDPVARQICDTIRQQKRENEELLVNYLKTVIDQADEEELKRLNELARFYREKSTKIVQAYAESYEKLGEDPDEILQHVLDVTDEFYEKVGLEA
ncbi:MAG: hypothetical protein SVW02_02255 [Candidatus Nanohaloarchaea archaeon]|nr:hypothetical protein [Candidatus Nanohaloarchaea archaeon]